MIVDNTNLFTILNQGLNIDYIFNQNKIVYQYQPIGNTYLNMDKWIELLTPINNHLPTAYEISQDSREYKYTPQGTVSINSWFSRQHIRNQYLKEIKFITYNEYQELFYNNPQHFYQVYRDIYFYDEPTNNFIFQERKYGKTILSDNNDIFCAFYKIDTTIGNVTTEISVEQADRENYGNFILYIVTFGNTIIVPNNLSHMFDNNNSLYFYRVTKIDFNNIVKIQNTEQSCTLAYLFNGCNLLQEVNLEQLGIKYVANDFSYSFSGCGELSNINNLLQSFNSITPTDMAYSFSHCVFNNLNLTNFNLTNCHNFHGCFSIATIKAMQPNLLTFITPLLEREYDNLSYMFFSSDLTGLGTFTFTNFSDIFKRYNTDPLPLNRFDRLVKFFDGCNFDTLIFDNMQLPNELLNFKSAFDNKIYKNYALPLFTGITVNNISFKNTDYLVNDFYDMFNDITIKNSLDFTNAKILLTKHGITGSAGSITGSSQFKYKLDHYADNLILNFSNTSIKIEEADSIRVLRYWGETTVNWQSLENPLRNQLSFLLYTLIDSSSYDNINTINISNHNFEHPEFLNEDIQYSYTINKVECSEFYPPPSGQPQFLYSGIPYRNIQHLILNNTNVESIRLDSLYYFGYRFNEETQQYERFIDRHTNNVKHLSLNGTHKINVADLYYNEHITSTSLNQRICSSDCLEILDMNNHTFSFDNGDVRYHKMGNAFYEFFIQGQENSLKTLNLNNTTISCDEIIDFSFWIDDTYKKLSDYFFNKGDMKFENITINLNNLTITDYPYSTFTVDKLGEEITLNVDNLNIVPKYGQTIQIIYE